MSLRKAMLLLCLLLGLVGARASAASAASLQSANEAYQRGDYAAALAGYEAVVEQGVVHEDLYYNLGNANYRAGRYGHALFNYERALRVAPGDEDTRYNRMVVREAVAADGRSLLHGAEKDAWWVRFSLDFSITATTLTLLVCNLLFFAGLVTLRFLMPGLVRTALVVLCVFLGVSTVASGLLLAGHSYANEKIHNGIVTADLAIMREGPDAGLEERGQLHPGLRVTLLASERDWLLIRLANGVEGWVPRSSIGLFD
jgi:tetratricopeptide (TPR) repeat protein